jgi:membrane protein
MDRCDGLAAAMAFFSLAALPGTVVVAFVGAHLLLSEETAKQVIAEWLGPRADFVRAFLVESRKMSPRDLHEIGFLGLASFVYGSVGYFSCLKDSLETIWDVRREEFGIVARIRRTAKALFVTLVVQLIIVGTVVVRALLPELARSPEVLALPYRGFLLLRAVETVIAFGFLFMITSFYFKFLTPVKLRWTQVWPGAAVTALLLLLVRPIAAHVLENEGWAQMLGTAGSLLAVLIWFYIFGALLLYGAELTRHHVELREPGVHDRRAAQTAAAERRNAARREKVGKAWKGVHSIFERRRS